MKAVGVISKIFLVLILLGVIVGIVIYFGGYDFYVNCDGQTVFDSAGGFKMTKDEPLKVDVGYVKKIGSKSSDKGYSVKIVPNVIKGKDFDYKMNGLIYSYQAETDLTAGFTIVQYDDYFTIAPKGGITEILRQVHPNSAIEDCNECSYENMYSMIIYPGDGEKYIKLNFTVIEDLQGVKLDKEAIQF